MAANGGGAGVNNDDDSGPQQPSSGGLGPSGYRAGVAVLVSLLIVVAVVRLTRYFLLRRSIKHPAAAGATDPSVTPTREAPAAPWPPAGAGVCVATYRRSDGWREATCPVCLCEFADGEALRVLPACMHYFHAACVSQWLLRNDTCPLCRAAPPPPPPEPEPMMPSPAVAPSSNGVGS